MTAEPIENTTTPLLYKVQEAAALLRMSRSAVYEQIQAGRLLTVHQGRSVFITSVDLDAYVELLRTEAEENR